MVNQRSGAASLPVSELSGKLDTPITERESYEWSATVQREYCPDESLADEEVDGAEENTPYSLFTYRQKWFMVTLLTIAGFWSSLGSPAVYPALKSLQEEFHVDEGMVNIAIVAYLLFQGIAPTITGGIADVYGRRPMILAGMVLFVLSSIQLAKAQSFKLIIIMRCIQSAGISPIIAINSGVVGDFTVKAERGTFVGAVSGLTLLGQAFGSFLGATLTHNYSWRAVFWFLAIGCGVCLFVDFLLLPETHRSIVGNLSVKPARLINRCPMMELPCMKRQFHPDDPDYYHLASHRGKVEITSALQIISCPEVFIPLIPAGLQFAAWTISLTALSSQLQAAPYNYDLQKVGICYLPSGLCGLTGSIVTGRLIDMWYRRSYSRFQSKVERGELPKNAQFNLLKARLIAGMPQNFVAVISFIIFGWSLQEGYHISIPLISSGVGTFCVLSTLSTSSTFLVDLYPEKPSTATGCYNFIRCTLSAFFLAIYTRMKQSMSIGGTFTLIASLIFIGNLLTFLPMKYGLKWRRKRILRSRIYLNREDHDTPEE